MWTGHVNGAHSAGARSLDVDGGELYNGFIAADIHTGHAVYTYTDYGTSRVRIKSYSGTALAGTFTLAENNVPWGDGYTVQVYNDYPLLPMFPRATGTDPDALNAKWYKDYNTAYTDQNENVDPVAIMGCDWAGELDPATNTVTATLDASDSYAMQWGETISSYSWVAEPAAGATIADAAAATTTVTFNTTGHWWIKVTIVDSNGQSEWTRRMFHVHSASHPAIALTGATINSVWEGNSCTCRFTVKAGDVDFDAFPDEARITIWSYDYLDGVLNYQGGYTGRQMVKFNGYLNKDSVRRVPGRSEVEFEAVSALDLLEQIEMYSVTLEYKTNPTRWNQYANHGITVAQALHHLWKWHSTLFRIHDVWLPTSATWRCKAVDDFERGTLLSQAKTLAYEHGIFANPAVNDQGIIHVERDAQIWPQIYADGYDLDTNREWTEMTIERQSVKPTSFVNLSGFSFNGTKATALLSKAPGSVLEDRGQSPMAVERQILGGQSSSNTVAGRVWAKENNLYPAVTLKMSRALSQSLALMVVPQLWHMVYIDAGDTLRGISWSGGQGIVPRNVSREYRPGYVEATISFEPYCSAPDGITGDYPSGGDDVDPPPDEPPPPQPPIPPTTPKVGVIFDEGNGCYVTFDMGATWTARNTGLPSSLKVLCGAWKRGWQTLQGTSDPESCILFCGGLDDITEPGSDLMFVRVSYDFGKNWVDRTPTADNTTLADALNDPFDAAEHWVIAMDCNNAVDNTLYALSQDANNAWLWKTIDMGLSWSVTMIPD